MAPVDKVQYFQWPTANGHLSMDGLQAPSLLASGSWLLASGSWLLITCRPRSLTLTVRGNLVTVEIEVICPVAFSGGIADDSGNRYLLVVSR